MERKVLRAHGALFGPVLACELHFVTPRTSARSGSIASDPAVSPSHSSWRNTSSAIISCLRRPLLGTVATVKTRLGISSNPPRPRPTNPFIYVEGEVGRAVQGRWTDGIRLSAALQAAGGLTKDADPTRLTIHHPNVGAEMASYVEATNSLARDNLLVGGDRIVVPRKKPQH